MAHIVTKWLKIVSKEDGRLHLLHLKVMFTSCPYSVEEIKDAETMIYYYAKNTIHQVTTMLATSKNVPFPGHNHLLTTSTDDPSLAGFRLIISTSGYDLEIGHFEKLLAWWIPGG